MTVFESGSVSDVWIWDLNRDILGRRTFTGNASRPIWSPDGQSVIYQSYDPQSEATNGIWSIQANGTSQPVPIFLSENRAWPRSVSSDNDLVLRYPKVLLTKRLS